MSPSGIRHPASGIRPHAPRITQHAPRPRPRIGVISDTHAYLDDQVLELFAGVEHILHAGDVGPLSLLRTLETVAPVTAVIGNTDGPIGLPLTELAEVAGLRFLVHHIVNPREFGDDLRARLDRDKPDAVVFGHTHRPFCETIEGVLFFNPGYAGRPKFGLERSVAILECKGRRIRPRYETL